MKAVVSNREQLARFFDQVAGVLTGKPIQIDIKPFKRDRTLPQSAKAHAMIRDIALHTGYTEAQAKEVVKAMFAPMKTVSFPDKHGRKGYTATIPVGTSEMTVDQMADFIEHLYHLGAELGVGFTERSDEV